MADNWHKNSSNTTMKIDQLKKDLGSVGFIPMADSDVQERRNSAGLMKVIIRQDVVDVYQFTATRVIVWKATFTDFTPNVVIIAAATVL